MGRAQKKEKKATHTFSVADGNAVSEKGVRRHAKKGPPPAANAQAKPAPASQLRAQTRKLLAKHYRAKHGVR